MTWAIYHYCSTQETRGAAVLQTGGLALTAGSPARQQHVGRQVLQHLYGSIILGFGHALAWIALSFLASSSAMYASLSLVNFGSSSLRQLHAWSWQASPQSLNATEDAGSDTG